MTDPYHDRLANEAEAHWVRHLAAAEDAGADPAYAVDVLSTAAAIAEASVIAWGEDGPITDERLADIVASYTLTLWKTLEAEAPDRLPLGFRVRLATLDRDLKRRRGLLGKET